jgi:nitrogen fixation/metabolism regulation signal transduction histidine kinase
MVYRRFGTNVVLLSILVGLCGTLFFWTLFREGLFFARISSGAIWLGLIAWLVRYVNRTNRSLSRFLHTVRTLDGNRQVTDAGGGSFDLLAMTYNEIIDTIQEVKIGKETEYQYFKSIFDHMSVGLLSFDGQGRIGLINKAACRLLDTKAPAHLDELEKKVEGITTILKDMGPGEPKLHRVIIRDEPLSLSVRKSLFVKQGQEISMVSLQNIHSELEEEEIEVWQKLISVLTHEIFNSVSPVKSLTRTLIRRAGKLEEGKDREDMLSGLRAIESRSRGLLSFVESYRNLSRIPEPVFSDLEVHKLLSDVTMLLKEETDKTGIRVDIRVLPVDLSIRGDERLLAQVLINLMGNAIFALEGYTDPLIEIEAGVDRQDRKYMMVRDNGAGIPDEIIDRIFIPFYTTREGGSGIGLSLARQIMHMHNASIRVSSAPGAGSTFVMVF